ncbi:MAG: UDP-N-acetylmuramoyl-tripeptide--D-alanyl-D-alanine ligase [Sedimentisphaerales bacterium]|nr:UDP-N-acetylmuramoyl-tripeptide--D-alanyl-D-alanine ligase [Sedimentisphaerales bacterium]
MNPLSIKKLAEIINAKTIPGSAENITGAGIDSRTLSKGSVFFAIKGENFDGHDFVKQALENGAACAVVEKKITGIDDKKILLVNSTVAALGDLAKFIRNNNDYKVIAITGSAGKTTVRSLVFHVLSGQFRCFTAPKSYNNNIGVPLTIFDAPENCEFVIAELGSNHLGEIQYLSQIACPDIALITTICPAHLAGLKSIDQIIKEKVSITAGLKPDGKFFINGTCKELVDYCRGEKIDFTTFGTDKDCDIRAKDIDLFGDKSTFFIEDTLVTLPLASRANVENASAAWAICKSIGILPEQFARSMADIKPVDMRMEILKFGLVTVLNDCYNANPGSMKNAIETLSLMAKRRKTRPVFIFGLMGELGSRSEEFHTILGRQIAENRISVLLTTKGDSAIAARTAEKYADFDISIEIFENVPQLCDNLYKFIQPDDIILVKASRSEHFESVVDKLKALLTEQ